MQKLDRDDETTSVAVRVTKSDKRLLMKRAHMEQINLSELIRRGIQRVVDGFGTPEVLSIGKRLQEAEAVIILAQDALGSDHPVWWILDGYDGSGDAPKELAARLASADLWRKVEALEADNTTLRRMFRQQQTGVENELG